MLKDFKPESSEDLKLNKTHGKTLVVLCRKGSRTMTELVQDLNIEKGSMTSVVDSLIEKSLIVRERDQDDRRKVIISLTEEGKKLANNLREEMNSFILTKLDQLGDERKKAVKSFITIAKESIEIWENLSET
jgi:DNA-binding MarR family transcriptional regulator